MPFLNMRTSLVLVFSLSYETFIVIKYTSTEHTPSPRMCTCSVHFIKLSITRDLCELGLEGVPQFKDETPFQNHYFVLLVIQIFLIYQIITQNTTYLTTHFVAGLGSKLLLF